MNRSYAKMHEKIITSLLQIIAVAKDLENPADTVRVTVDIMLRKDSFYSDTQTDRKKQVTSTYLGKQKVVCSHLT